MKPEDLRSRSSDSLWAPWPRLLPWVVMVAGLLLGRWVGYSPSLFVAMAATCLLLGVLRSA